MEYFRKLILRADRNMSGQFEQTDQENHSFHSTHTTNVCGGPSY